ncbi:MAG: DUF1326 domain-containing protein [Candidatus Binataceae bacterium]
MGPARETWNIEGEYFESCNCTVLCPCVLSNMTERPTEGHCDAVLAFHIGRGGYGQADLTGLNAAMALYTPGPMGQGNWRMALYLDSRAGAGQLPALEAIFSGAAGGPLAAFGALVATAYPAKTVPIDFTIDGNRRKLTIGELCEIEVEGIAGRGKNNVVWLENVIHPAASRIAAARSTASRLQDGPLNFENSGRNAHFAPISWSGEV